MIPKALHNAILALLAAIEVDEHRSGGLLSRLTLRKAAELLHALADLELDPDSGGS